MLKGIDPLLSPDLLRVLRAMGHGDEIAIVDGNYPAEEHGKRVVRIHRIVGDLGHKFDILAGGQAGHQIVELKDKTHMIAPIQR